MRTEVVAGAVDDGAARPQPHRLVDALLHERAAVVRAALSADAHVHDAGSIAGQRKDEVECFEHRLEQVAIAHLSLVELCDAGAIAAKDFPAGAPLAVDQSQGFAAGPQAIIGQQQKLGLGVGQCLNGGVVTVHLADEGAARLRLIVRGAEVPLEVDEHLALGRVFAEFNTVLPD